MVFVSDAFAQIDVDKNGRWPLSASSASVMLLPSIHLKTAPGCVLGPQTADGAGFTSRRAGELALEANKGLFSVAKVPNCPGKKQ